MTSAFRPFVEALGVLAAFPSRSSRQPLFITAATKFNQLSVQVLYCPSYTRVLFVFHSPFYIFFFCIQKILLLFLFWVVITANRLSAIDQTIYFQYLCYLSVMVKAVGCRYSDLGSPLFRSSGCSVHHDLLCRGLPTGSTYYALDNVEG